MSAYDALREEGSIMVALKNVALKEVRVLPKPKQSAKPTSQR